MMPVGLGMLFELVFATHQENVANEVELHPELVPQASEFVVFLPELVDKAQRKIAHILRVQESLEVMFNTQAQS